MKCFNLTNLRKLGFLFMGLFLSSCSVSPKWAAETMGGSVNSRSLNVSPNFQEVNPSWGYPNQALQMSAPYHYSQNHSMGWASNTIEQPAPMMVPRHKVFVPPPVQTTQIAAPTPQVPKKSSLSRGKVRLVNKRAIAPADAPPVVRRAVEAGNRMQKFPYKWGGGHAVLNDTGYDCSGAVSYVLREAGIMSDQMTSKGFLNFGEAGEGDWITVWAKEGHVFVIIGGLRLDTGGSSVRTGPRWKPESRHYKGFIARHPSGL